MTWKHWITGEEWQSEADYLYYVVLNTPERVSLRVNGLKRYWKKQHEKEVNPNRVLFEPKVKKVNRKLLIKNLDSLVSKIVRLQEPQCVVCGSTEKCGNGHVFSRKSYSTRWDIRKDGNCHNQCWSCNYRHVTDQYPYFDWYISKFGKNRFDELRKEFKTSRKFSNIDLQRLHDELMTLYANILNKEPLPF